MELDSKPLGNKFGSFTDSFISRKRQFEEESKNQLENSISVISSVFSPCGEYLVCGSNTGHICIWYIGEFENINLETEKNINNNRKIGSTVIRPFVFEAHQNDIYDLKFCGNNLVSCGEDGISLWEMPQDLSDLKETPKCVNLQQRHGKRDDRETNSLVFNEYSKILYSGCGDSNLYAWDIEAQKCVQQFEGHNGPIYCTALSNNNLIYSGGEDGYVRIWDSKASNCLKTLCTTTGICIEGKGRHLPKIPWISCMELDEMKNWMVCGGGNGFLSLWSIPMDYSVTTTFPTNGNPQCANFQSNSIITGGNENKIYHWKKDGALEKQIKAKSSSIYSLSSNKKYIAVTGNSNNVEIFFEKSLRMSALRFTIP